MRVLDVIFLIYFVTHIPISLLVDFQAVIPVSMYPDQLVAVKEWYCREYRDPMMMDPPAWFKSFCLCEMLVQFPFFFVAAYAYFKGAARSKWIRLPIIVYSSHVATTVIAIIYHVLVFDFSNSKHPGPRDIRERTLLCAIYSPYLLVPLMLLADSLFSQAYRAGPALTPKNKKHR